MGFSKIIAPPDMSAEEIAAIVEGVNSDLIRGLLGGGDGPMATEQAGEVFVGITAGLEKAVMSVLLSGVLSLEKRDEDITELVETFSRHLREHARAAISSPKWRAMKAYRDEMIKAAKEAGAPGFDRPARPGAEETVHMEIVLPGDEGVREAKGGDAQKED